jgi:hypothetical protein
MSRFFNIDLPAAFKRLFGHDDKAVVQVAEDSPVIERLHQENESVAEAPVKLTVWTIERNRYTAARALCTDIEVFPSSATPLCEDIKGYVFDTPNGESVVIEARTGTLVGHSLEVVRDGVREMSKVQLNNQLDTGKKEFNRMKKIEMSNDDFWKAIKMGSEEVEPVQDFQE